MGIRIPRLLSAPSAIPEVSGQMAAKMYPRLRAQVFIGIFLGYAGFYLIRNNIPLVASLIIKDGRIDLVGIGIISNAVLVSYGLSKFFSALVSDKSNARYFLPIGLSLSAIINLLIASLPILSSSLSVFAVVMFINGWFQGMGWPPCGRVLVHWFSTNERGLKTAMWNVAHNVGGFLVGILSAIGLQISGNSWQSAFWIPALVAILISLIAAILIRDTPESQGLPPIEVYRNDPAKISIDDTETSTHNTWQVVRRHILTNRTMVLLALANMCIYTLRYGILTWTPIYLSTMRGASLGGGIAGFSLFELTGIVGTIICGWLSDRVFRGDRSITGIVYMFAVIGTTAVYWLAPVNTPLWVLLASVSLIGGLIYGPVMLIGLQALDLSPRQVAGTAAGFTGLFGYVLGATIASSGIGLIIHTLGWDAAFITFILSAILTIVFLALIRTDERTMHASEKH